MKTAIELGRHGPSTIAGFGGPSPAARRRGKKYVPADSSAENRGPEALAGRSRGVGESQPCGPRPGRRVVERSAERFASNRKAAA
jgi:hypothetical protein